MNWIKVSEQLPACTEPFMVYNDDNITRQIAWENDHVFVLAFDSEKGIVKAKFDRNYRWAEVSSISISPLNPTHWMPLPEPPKE